MKNIVLLLFGALILTLVGFAAVAVARVERYMADAQQYMTTFQYPAVQESLDAADQYIGYGRLSAIGRDASAEVRARRAALQYWQQEYQTLLPAQAEPVCRR